MKKNNSLVDGFVPRRPGGQLGELHDAGKKEDLNIAKSRLLGSTGASAKALGRPQLGNGLGRSDIDESLKEIDDSSDKSKKLSRKQRRKITQKLKRPRSLPKRILRWVAAMVIVLVVGVGGYMAYKLINAGGNVLQGNLFDVFNSKPLKEDNNGRSNFLVLGTSEDDPGHAGAGLTDSILVVSVDQKNKNAYMFSVPRDLYVQYGMACNSGYSGKINEYFGCVNAGTTAEAEQDRLTKTQKFIGDIFGLDIQYGVHVNHTVIKEAVDAVGGIDVDIQGSNGAPGVLDRNFDWRCNYTCYLVKYDNGVHHLDGEHALFLSMARGDIAPTYGLGNSNFDREKNQQKILMALRDKAMSTGTLTNLGAITKLIDALGNNLRTNVKADELNTLMQLANSIKSQDIHTLTFVGENIPLVGSQNVSGMSVVVPTAGTFDYTAIRAYLRQNLSSDPVTREAAPIVVLNGTTTSGLGQGEADKLVANGYNVSAVDNAPAGSYDKIEVYQVGSGNSGTAAALSKLYGVSVKKTTPPVSVNGDVRFVIIIGAATT